MTCHLSKDGSSACENLTREARHLYVNVGDTVKAVELYNDALKMHDKFGCKANDKCPIEHNVNNLRHLYFSSLS